MYYFLRAQENSLGALVGFLIFRRAHVRPVVVSAEVISHGAAWIGRAWRCAAWQPRNLEREIETEIPDAR